MIDEQKIKIYETEAMYHCVDIQKLLTFLLNVTAGMPGKIQESEVHGAFLCLKAQDKRNIEQNLSLSKNEKEIEKEIVDKFYERFENALIEELNGRCSIRFE